ncbi:hypothetical protein DFJ73DRAFT_875029 [Zopfochytrium polystomum]|nr:hypothetical protein DFJ73DRAFT_875029 [Zopfochytrium polystomum]
MPNTEVVLVLVGLSVLMASCYCRVYQYAVARSEARVLAASQAQTELAHHVPAAPSTDFDQDALPLYSPSPADSAASTSAAHPESGAGGIELTQILTTNGPDAPVTSASPGEERYPPTPSLAPPIYSPS